MVDLLPMEERAERSNRTEAWRREFVIRSGARCHYCNRRSSPDLGPDDRPWHIDHKRPLARGGTDDEENLVLACKRCNLVKHTSAYKDFVELARRAFWQPDDEWRVSEHELGMLTDLYDRAVPLQIRVDYEHLRDGRGNPAYGHYPLPYADRWYVGENNNAVLVNARSEDDSSDAMVPRPLLRVADDLDENRVRLDGTGAIDLIVRVHAALPALIAEIRLLRAENAELRADRA